jgi:hypothetical protein
VGRPFGCAVSGGFRSKIGWNFDGGSVGCLTALLRPAAEPGRRHSLSRPWSRTVLQIVEREGGRKWPHPTSNARLNPRITRARKSSATDALSGFAQDVARRSAQTPMRSADGAGGATWAVRSGWTRANLSVNTRRGRRPNHRNLRAKCGAGPMRPGGSGSLVAACRRPLHADPRAPGPGLDGDGPGGWVADQRGAACRPGAPQSRGAGGGLVPASDSPV